MPSQRDDNRDKNPATASANQDREPDRGRTSARKRRRETTALPRAERGDTAILERAPHDLGDDARGAPAAGARPDAPGVSFKTLRLTAEMVSDIEKLRPKGPEESRPTTRFFDATASGASSSAAPSHNNPRLPRGAALGRYTAIRRIGRGGMGTVFLCHIHGAYNFRRQVAVKVLRQDMAEDERCVRTLLHEGYVGALVDNPHLVRCLDLGVHENQPYLVMDYVEGRTLAELLAESDAAIPLDVAMRIFVDALAGLSALHGLCDEQGTPLEVVHCDVSPYNLLIGRDGHCRLIDLSSARSRLLQPNARQTDGRAAYLAPERILGQTFDRRADLFSLGVVLHESLTGRRLFWAEAQPEMMRNVLHGPIEKPSRLNPTLPASCDELILQFLAREPEDRFPSARAAQLALHRMAMSLRQLATANDVADWASTRGQRAATSAPDKAPGYQPANNLAAATPLRSRPRSRLRRMVTWAAGLFTVLTLAAAAAFPHLFASAFRTDDVATAPPPAAERVPTPAAAAKPPSGDTP